MVRSPALEFQDVKVNIPSGQVKEGGRVMPALGGEPCWSTREEAVAVWDLRVGGGWGAVDGAWCGLSLVLQRPRALHWHFCSVCTSWEGEMRDEGWLSW